jgi:hypothetical protein
MYFDLRSLFEKVLSPKNESMPYSFISKQYVADAAFCYPQGVVRCFNQFHLSSDTPVLVCTWAYRRRRGWPGGDRTSGNWKLAKGKRDEE